LTSLVLIGCVFVDQYPVEWDSIKLSTDKTCPDVSGKFRDRGERENSSFEPSLSYLLLQLHNQKTADTVEIKFVEPTQLLFRVFSEQQLQAESLLSSSKGEFQCSDGFVIIKRGEFINREGVFAGERWTFSLAPSKNGLVIKEKDSAVGMMFIVPVVGTSTTWSRYPRAN
jgi:hypothetical protein